MDVPISEVGYTTAMPMMEAHEVHKGHVLALGGKKFRSRFTSYKNVDRPRGFQEVKVPRLRDNGTGWW